MKAKKGYSGLGTFAPSVAMESAGWLKVRGNEGKVRLINELFDSGRDEEARTLLRDLLGEVTRDLDRMLADELSASRDTGLGDNKVPSVMASASLNR